MAKGDCLYKGTVDSVRLTILAVRCFSLYFFFILFHLDSSFFASRVLAVCVCVYLPVLWPCALVIWLKNNYSFALVIWFMQKKNRRGIFNKNQQTKKTQTEFQEKEKSKGKGLNIIAFLIWFRIAIYGEFVLNCGRFNNKLCYPKYAYMLGRT